MKKIDNYHTALEEFEKYIENSFKPNRLNKIYQDVFEPLKSYGIEIYNGNDIKKYFLIKPDTIKQVICKIDKNSKYKALLANVKKYKDLNKISKEKYKKKNPDSDVLKFINLQKKYDNFYKAFTEYKNRTYCYNIIKKLEIRACPYCNLNYIDAVIGTDEKTKVRHHFDHFYPISRYPFLGLSFFNLIPSCYECNSGLKGEQTHENLPHPYIDDFSDTKIFKITVSGEGELSDYFKDLESFDIEIETEQNKKIEQINTTFALQDRYKYRKEEAREIIARKAIFTTKEMKKEIEHILELKELDEGFYNQIVFGNYIKMHDINKRPLAKLTQDMINYHKLKIGKNLETNHNINLKDN